MSAINQSKIVPNKVRDKIVAKYDLRSRNLRELVGQGDQHVDFAFAYGAPKDRGPS
jgi:hypothetical protein